MFVFGETKINFEEFLCSYPANTEQIPNSIILGTNCKSYFYGLFFASII